MLSIDKDKVKIDDNEMLFLYNKYSYNFKTWCVDLNDSKTTKMYKLRYIFTLK